MDLVLRRNMLCFFARFFVLLFLVKCVFERTVLPLVELMGRGFGG